MLSLEIVKAVSLLKEINYGLSGTESARKSPLSEFDTRRLLSKLHSSGLIRLKAVKNGALGSSSYELCYPIYQISLCDILVATGGGIELSVENTEDIYNNYGMAGKRLGVLNQMACRYLSEIHLTDVFLSESGK
ncbi:hypothetical protein [Bacteroides ihuae]|uniref:hypothetical protein n=1 Tax=Bacteroides ihuae TaxID=1852362 RepID=UPI0008D931A6|nr:hypothetical protein [Bacteroides ihuae]